MVTLYNLTLPYLLIHRLLGLKVSAGVVVPGCWTHLAGVEGDAARPGTRTATREATSADIANAIGIEIVGVVVHTATLELKGRREGSEELNPHADKEKRYVSPDSAPRSQK